MYTGCAHNIEHRLVIHSGHAWIGNDVGRVREQRSCLATCLVILSRFAYSAFNNDRILDQFLSFQFYVERNFTVTFSNKLKQNKKY